jgi:hypothetical protein
VRRHYKEDEQDIEREKAEMDLTKKDPLIKVKYLRYETFHDKYFQGVKEVSSHMNYNITYRTKNLKER